MPKYTVKTATPTGKNDATYGAEYLVQFEEDGRVVKMSRKNVPQPGQEENGQIIDGKYGAYFKKDPFQPTPQGGAVNVPEKKWAPVRKDNSDGMRQGMCFNNAAAYVAAISPEPLPPNEWAKAVNAYAQALYLVSELSKEVPQAKETPATTEVPKNIQQIFGVTEGQAAPAK